jgi:hypothetical protein
MPVGVQISKPVGRLIIRRGIETFGGTGDSLVKGVIMPLSAIALSVKPGGSARAIEIDGGITTNGQGIVPIEMHGTIDVFRINGGAKALGGGFDKIYKLAVNLQMLIVVCSGIIGTGR